MPREAREKLLTKGMPSGTSNRINLLYLVSMARIAQKSEARWGSVR